MLQNQMWSMALIYLLVKYGTVILELGQSVLKYLGKLCLRNIMRISGFIRYAAPRIAGRNIS